MTRVMPHGQVTPDTPAPELFRRRLAYHATTIAYSSDSRLLALGTENGQVRFWNARSGVPQGPPIHPSTASVSQMWFSPDGPLLVVSAQDGFTTLWDVRSRKQVGVSFPSRPGVLTASVFEPKGPAADRLPRRRRGVAGECIGVGAIRLQRGGAESDPGRMAGHPAQPLVHAGLPRDGMRAARQGLSQRAGAATDCGEPGTPKRYLRR